MLLSPGLTADVSSASSLIGRCDIPDDDSGHTADDDETAFLQFKTVHDVGVASAVFLLCATVRT
jgi:hypothetical protein